MAEAIASQPGLAATNHALSPMRQNPQPLAMK